MNIRNLVQNKPEDLRPNYLLFLIVAFIRAYKTYRLIIEVTNDYYKIPYYFDIKTFFKKNQWDQSHDKQSCLLFIMHEITKKY